MTFTHSEDLQRLSVAVHHGSTPEEDRRIPWLALVLIVGAHVLLAIFVRRLALIGTLHAAATFLAGLYFASKDRTPERVAFILAYIAGAEVFWRMSGSQLVWEFGKYAVSAIIVLFFIQQSQRNSPPWQAVAYFVVLLPSGLLTLVGLQLSAVRNAFSFNLSGPLSLALSICFFYALRLSAGELKRLLLAGLAPIAGVVTLVIQGILSRPSITFRGESNFATSGGFGPNQVSAILGLGALLAFLFAMIESSSLLTRLTLFACTLAFATQSALTFSRGGLYAATGACLAALPFFLRNRRTLVGLLIGLPVLALVSVIFIVPWLNSYTGGTLSQRFQDTEASHREDLISADLEVWREHPWLGVGPGMADEYRGSSVKVAASHTEFSRLLSEHGSFGALAIVLLVWLFAQRMWEKQNDSERALMSALTIWGCLFMMTSGMRLVAPCVAIGIGGVGFVQRRRMKFKVWVP